MAQLTRKGNEKPPEKYSLSPIERETQILWNDTNEPATIFTCNKALQKELQSKGYVAVGADKYGGVLFECNKKDISFKKLNRKKKVLSEEHKLKLRKSRENKHD